MLHRTNAQEYTTRALGWSLLGPEFHSSRGCALGVDNGPEMVMSHVTAANAARLVAVGRERTTQG